MKPYLEFSGDLNTSEVVTRDSLVRIADLIGMPTEGRKVNDTTVSQPNSLFFHVFPCSVRKNMMIVRVFYHSDLDLKKTAQIFEDVLKATSGRWILMGKTIWLSVSDL